MGVPSIEALKSWPHDAARSTDVPQEALPIQLKIPAHASVPSDVDLNSGSVLLKNTVIQLITKNLHSEIYIGWQASDPSGSGPCKLPQCFTHLLTSKDWQNGIHQEKGWK